MAVGWASLLFQAPIDSSIGVTRSQRTVLRPYLLLPNALIISPIHFEELLQLMRPAEVGHRKIGRSAVTEPERQK